MGSAWINILLLPVTCNLCRSSVYNMLLKFENLPVIVTGRKRILLVTHEIVPDSDRWPSVISCTDKSVGGEGEWRPAHMRFSKNLQWQLLFTFSQSCELFYLWSFWDNTFARPAYEMISNQFKSSMGILLCNLSPDLNVSYTQQDCFGLSIVCMGGRQMRAQNPW